eukprot:s97_g31.t1
MVGFSTKHAHGQLPAADGRLKDVFFRSDHFAVIASQPRLLVIRVCTPIFRCIVVAAHAPHTGAPEAEIAAWWQAITDAVPLKYATWGVVLLADANARVGSFPSQHVGAWQAEADTVKSDSFLDFLQRHELWLPSTFEPYQLGPGGTWRHSTGKWLRNDFIAIPLSWPVQRLSAFVNTNIDASIAKEDHATVTVELQMPVACQTPRHGVRSTKRKEADLIALDGANLEASFHVDWHVDVHTHADRLQSFLLDCIPQQPTQRKPLKSTMSDATWQLVCEKRFWRNQMWTSNHEARHLILRMCFASWSDAAATPDAVTLRALVKQQDHLCATAYGQFRRLGLQVVQATRADDRVFFSTLSRQASELTSPSQSRAFWQVIRRSLPKMKARKHSIAPMKIEHLEDQWHPYFQDLEVIEVIQPLKPAGQIGGFGGQQVQFGSMTLQCLSRIAKHRHLSMGVVFVDLANAFHRLLRELVCGVARQDDVDTLLQALSSSSRVGVQKWLELPCLLHRLGAPDRLLRLLRDVHSHTWHVLSMSPDITRTRRGTRPGSPLADVIFHVIMLDVTLELNTWVEAQSTFQSLLQHLDITTEAIVWSDDLAIPWLTTDAAELLPALERLLQQIHKVFTRRGFDLNMQKGKTAAIVTFRGAGAPDLRRQYQLASPSGMVCQLTPTEQCWLHISPAYKHLGTFLATDSGFQMELASRIGQAKAAFSSLSKAVLCNRHLPVRTRLRLFHALVGTKLFFGLGSWPTPSGKHLTTLNAFLVKCLRRILGLAHYEGSVRTTDARVFAQARCLDARARIAQDRLLLAQKLFQHGPAFVHHLVHREFETHDSSWLHGVMDDLRWLHALEPEAVPAVWTSSLTDPIECWQAGGAGWKALLRRAGRRHVFQEGMMAEVAVCPITNVSVADLSPQQSDWPRINGFDMVLSPQNMSSSLGPRVRPA